jgi:hypothetical protein
MASRCCCSAGLVDAVNMPPGATIAEMLPDAMENCRSVILLLSKDSVSRGWVQQEYNAAINHQTRHRAFRIIPAGLDSQSASGILKGLYQPATSIQPINGRDVYVSRGWDLDDAKLADTVRLALEDAGLQLVRDAEDQPSWGESRLRTI